jgi:hypothetical protein
LLAEAEFLPGLLLEFLPETLFVWVAAEVAVVVEVMTKAMLKVNESKVAIAKCGRDNFIKVVYQSLTIGLNLLLCLGFAHVKERKI